MALIPKFIVKELPNALSAQITDKTGDFSVINVGGFGTPNLDVANVTGATLSLTFHDPTTLLPTGSPVSFSIFSSGNFPNTNNIYTTIYPTDYGIAAATPFTEGVYYMSYNITGTGVSETANKYIVLWAQTRCCVEKISAATDLDCCGCSSSAQKKALRIIFLKHALKDAAACGNLDRAVDALKKLQAICAGTGCEDCN